MSPPTHAKAKGTVLVHWLCFQAADGQEAAAMLSSRGGAGNGGGGGGGVG
jgi:hypothetical protein